MSFLEKSDGTREPDQDGSRFWVCDLDPAEPDHEHATAIFGRDTVGIVDEEEGGIVLFIHGDNAPALVAAMQAYTGEV